VDLQELGDVLSNTRRATSWPSLTASNGTVSFSGSGRITPRPMNRTCGFVFAIRANSRSPISAWPERL
jgi:hypothetical protein